MPACGRASVLFSTWMMTGAPEPIRAGVSLGGNLNHRREAQLPVGGEGVVLAVQGGLRNAEQILTAGPQLEIQRRALGVAGPGDLLCVKGFPVERDRRLGAVHRLREVDLDRPGRCARMEGLLAIFDQLVIDLHVRDGGGGLRLEAEAAGHLASTRRGLGAFEADVIGGARLHGGPELELARADCLEGHDDLGRDDKVALHRVRVHILVEAEVDRGRARHRLVAIADVGADFEWGGQDADDNHRRDHEDRDRGQPPAFTKRLCPGH